MTIASFTANEVAAYAAGFAVGNVVNRMRSKMAEYMAKLIGHVVLLVVFINSEVGKEFREQYPFLVGFFFAAIYLEHVILILPVYEGNEEKIFSFLILIFGTAITLVLYLLISPATTVIIPAEWILVVAVKNYSKQIQQWMIVVKNYSKQIQQARITQWIGRWVPIFRSTTTEPLLPY